MFRILLFLLFVTKTFSFFDDEKQVCSCKGIAYTNVTLAAYFPNDLSDLREEGIYDIKGNSLHTLQDYLDDRTKFVTIAMDPNLNIPYGTQVCIPELNEHFGHLLKMQVRDSSSDLIGMGYNRADICVRSEMDSYDATFNRDVTLIFIK